MHLFFYIITFHFLVNKLNFSELLKNELINRVAIVLYQKRTNTLLAVIKGNEA